MRGDARAEHKMCYTEIMLHISPIRQLEVAGQELAFFAFRCERAGRHAWTLLCTRNKASDKAIAAVKQALEGIADRDRVPITYNWEEAYGSVEIDDVSNKYAYIIHFEDKDGSRYRAALEAMIDGRV